MTIPATSSSSPDNRQPAAVSKPRKRRWHWVISVFLLVAIEFVFVDTTQFDFVNCDDDQIVRDNPHVIAGLSARNVAWAFSGHHPESWCPLTTISHEVDCQLFGFLRPGGHHLHNVLLHTASTILLFYLLWQMTGGLWPSAFVAAVFAVHPLHVESVAWVTERKDVLSGLFFMLALGAYQGYLRRRHWATWYAAMVILFALGLLAKPCVMTFPFVLLLLDYWPLGRMIGAAHRSFNPEPTATVNDRMPWAVAAGSGLNDPLPQQGLLSLVLEKLPLFVLVPISCWLSVWGLGTALQIQTVSSWWWRIQNALIAYASYLVQCFYPVNLSVMHPRRPLDLPIGQVVMSLVLLLIISLAAWVWRRKCPYLLVGWLWYLGMLLPVIAMVQFGTQSEADRYMYLPQIGLVIALAWGAVDLCRSWPYLRWVCGAVSALVLASLMALASQQTAYWRDSETLWNHALACNPDNPVAYSGLGETLFCQGQIDEAVKHYQKALDLQPDNVLALRNMGRALAVCGQFKEAIACLRMALELQPNEAEAHNNLANCLVTAGQFDEAMKQYREAIRLRPDYVVAERNSSIALAKQGRYGEAIAHYRKALEILPGYPDAQIGLAWLLATSPQESLRNGETALAIALEADRRSGGNRLDPLKVLAAAYAEVGLFPDAIATASKALGLATHQKKQELVDELQAQLALYKAGKPYRQPLAPPAVKPQASATPAVKPQASATPAAKPQAPAAPTAKPQASATPAPKPQASATPAAKPAAPAIKPAK